MAWKAFLEELFGDLLPVVHPHAAFGCTMLTHRVVELMGMEAFFMAMYDSPDEVHRLMAYLRDNALRSMRWAEREGLLRLNNGNQDSFGSSFNFTTQLPAPGFNGAVRTCDMWGSRQQPGDGRRLARACSTSSASPTTATSCEPMGLLYYGCCEPAHPFWEDIRQLPHLKKVSISRWCDEKFMGDALRGTDIVFSRKPDPNFLSVDASSTRRPGPPTSARRSRRRAACPWSSSSATSTPSTATWTTRNARSSIARREIDKHYRP